MKLITKVFFVLFIFLNSVKAQDKLEFIDEHIKFENDSLISIGQHFKKVTNYSYFSWDFFSYNSDFNKKYLFSDEDIEARGGSFNFSKMKISKNLYENYNLLKSEIIENGLLAQYASFDKTVNEFGNEETLSSFYFELDYSIGLGTGYGWLMKNENNLLINNSTGLNIGFTVRELASSDNIIESTSEPEGITRDFFKSNVMYFFSKKFGMSLGVTRYNTYNSFSILEGVASKTLETGTYYLVDEYLIDYMVKKKIEGIPIYNLLIQNLISYGIYAIKKNNDLFPFKGNNGTLGFQYQIGFHFKY